MVVQSNERLWLSTGEEGEPEYEDEAIVADVYCNPRRRAFGFWAITQHVWDPTVRLFSDRSLTVEETDQIRGLMADVIERDHWSSLPEYAALMRLGAGPVHHIVWSGYVHNAAISLLGMALIWSLGWVRDRLVTQRNAVRLARGWCPVCAYDLRGDVLRGCPECGWRREGCSETSGRRT